MKIAPYNLVAGFTSSLETAAIQNICSHFLPWADTDDNADTYQILGSQLKTNSDSSIQNTKENYQNWNVFPKSATIICQSTTSIFMHYYMRKTFLDLSAIGGFKKKSDIWIVHSKILFRITW